MQTHSTLSSPLYVIPLHNCNNRVEALIWYPNNRAMSSVTTEELRLFHKIDRELYFRLVVSLRRDAVQSMQVMALWLWIEQIGYPNIVYLMLPLSDPLVNAVAEEAILCLTCLESDSPPPYIIDDDLPVTSKLMNKEISLQFFYRNRFLVINGVTKTVNDVCLRAFEDIAKQVLADAAAAAVSLFHYSAVRPRFPSPPLFGVPQPSLLGTPPIPNIAQIFHLGELNLDGETSDQQSGALFLNPTARAARPWSPGEEVPEVEQNEQETPQDGRTMFVTFSRGYPMTEKEVREFFTRNFGDCIETIIMQEVAIGDQSLYARLVFYSVSQILDILDGRDKVKFVINGKHVWARLYVAKQGIPNQQSRVPPPPPTPPRPSTA